MKPKILVLATQKNESYASEKPYFAVQCTNRIDTVNGLEAFKLFLIYVKEGQRDGHTDPFFI